MKKDIKALHNRYFEAYAEYCRLFANKHDLVLYEDDIELDMPILMSDYYISFDVIMYDLDNDIPVGVWEEFYDTMLELYTLDAHTCNYPSWCKGYRPYTKEQIERMKHSQKKIEEMQKQLQEMIKQDHKDY